MTERFGRIAVAVLIVMSCTTAAGAADNQIRPFVGTTFQGETTFVTPGFPGDRAHLVIGASHVTMGEIFGVDVEVADAPRFFEGRDNNKLVLSGRVTTVSGNLVIAAPRRLTEYGFRPYFLAGGGVMRLTQNTTFDAFNVTRILPAFDVGGGVLAFFTNRVGFSWEVRRFQNFHRRSDPTGFTVDTEERLSFWRAGVGLVFRY